MLKNYESNYTIRYTGRFSEAEYAPKTHSSLNNQVVVA